MSKPKRPRQNVERVPIDDQLTGLYRDVALYGYKCGVKSRTRLQTAINNILPYAPIIPRGLLPRFRKLASNDAKTFYNKCLFNWISRHAGSTYNRDKILSIYGTYFQRGEETQEQAINDAISKEKTDNGN